MPLRSYLHRLAFAVGSSSSLVWAWVAPCLLLWRVPLARADAPALAIIGDSLSTGAVTHPALRFDGQVLWDVFTGAVSMQPRLADLPAEFAAGLSEPLAAPQRLWPSSREFFGGPDWVWRHTLQSLSRRYLDTAEYSWGYMLGLGLHLTPSDIVLAGEDGARVAAMPRHLDRLLDAAGGELPRRLAIFYTGNDLCGSSMNDITASDDFAADLQRGMQYLVRNGRPAVAGGSDIYVLSFLNILQLLTSESILGKKVHAFGGEISCRDLRAASYQPTPVQQQAMQARIQAEAKRNPLAWYFAMVMPPNPAAFCSTLFAVGSGAQRDAEIGSMANHIRSYREHAAALVQTFHAAHAAQGWRFHFIEATSGIVFTGDDIAEDCFHLSVSGQAKIAHAVLAAFGGP